MTSAHMGELQARCNRDKFKVEAHSITITLTGVHDHASTATLLIECHQYGSHAAPRPDQTTPSAIHNGLVSEPLPLTIDPS
jgi:hypothetical protein